jgi:hypothetical protein
MAKRDDMMFVMGFVPSYKVVYNKKIFLVDGEITILFLANESLVKLVR